MLLQSTRVTRGKGLCLLSLDAGGTRAISQLTILAQMMHQLNYNTKDDSLDRPCTAFDMIGGVGSGGFIAILFVVLGLKIEDSIEEFTNLSVNVLDKQGVDADTRTAILSEHVDGLLKKYQIDRTSRLLDLNERSKGCKLAVPVSYKQHVGSICILRNFSSRRETTPNLTIAEAMMATLTTPPLFTSTQVLKDAATFEYIGADWTHSNPTQEIIAEAHEAFGAEAKVACILNLGCGHPGIFISPNHSNLDEWNQFLERLALDAERKAQTLDAQMGRLGIYSRFSVSNGLERITSAATIGLGEIMTHTKVYLDDTQVTRKMDSCVESLRIRDGVSSLDQIRHTGGQAILTPQLPPLTKTFVMRKKPWEFVERVLLGPRDPNDIDGPRMLFITGIGGCGKTQLMLRFMKEHKSQFAYQFFIDGSSEDRIRADIIRNVRALGTEYSQKGFEDCVLFLSYPSREGRSLLLYDNVDDPNLDLSSLLPQGDACAIAITSRNGLLGDTQPEVHLQLDIMSLDEATELLIHGLSLSASALDRVRSDVLELAQALGCLPIALQQACAYMRQAKCSPREYLERLSVNREKLLGQAIKLQVNMRSISTYAAFETSFRRLPRASQKLIRLLSCLYWGRFPLELVKLAARYKFAEYDMAFVEHGDDYHTGKMLLEDIFLDNGEWKITNLDDMIISLQNYSLVSTVRGVDTLLLQMHPLTHEWVHEYIPMSEKHSFQSAAILLVALGARDERTAATQYLASHITHMEPYWNHLHVNDSMAFGSILYQNGLYQSALKVQEHAIDDFKQYSDADDTKFSDLLLNLSLTLSASGELKEAERLQKEAIEIRKKILGVQHPDTITASANLAGTYRELGKLIEAKVLQEEVVNLRKAILGARHLSTLTASNNLANIYVNLGTFNEVKVLQEEMLELKKEILGKRHSETINASNNLANTYRRLGRLNDAKVLQEEVLELCKEILGEKHPTTCSTSGDLAISYRELGMLNEAKALEEEVLELRKNTLGDRHPDTLVASNNLALTYSSLGMLDEAKALQEEVLELRKEVLGERHPDTISVSGCLANTYRGLGRLQDAQFLREKVLEMSKAILGELHPDTVIASNNLAITYMDLGRFNEAKALQEKVLEQRKEILGKRHPDTLAAFNNLAGTYQGLGMFNEAKVLQEEVLELRTEILGEQHPDTITASSNLAIAYKGLGMLNEAKILQERALEKSKEVLGERHPDTFDASANLASTYSDLGKLEEAKLLEKEVLRLRKQVLGEQHPDTIDAAKNLAITSRMLQRSKMRKEYHVSS